MIKKLLIPILLLNLASCGNDPLPNNIVVLDAYDHYKSLPEYKRQEYLDDCYNSYDEYTYGQAYLEYQTQWTIWYPDRFLQMYCKHHRRKNIYPFSCGT